MQREVIDFLSTPAAYGVTSIERIDTHISIVWLAGDRAFKLKREVRFDYVNFSTAELRRVACEAEIRINRRTAPDLYLGVRAVTREADGTLAIDGRGVPIDWLVEMARFDQDMLFDRLAERGQLDLSLMAELAEEIVRLHASACIHADRGGRAGLAWVVDGNAVGFAQQGAGILAPVTCARLTADAHAEIQRHAARLDRRARGGLVRECHGDLHLRNICLRHGRPTIFDGVEFNDDLSCIDVLYDLAFLVMDLWYRGLPAHANAVLNEYVLRTADIDALCLMPLFLSCRAAVRAKTSVTAAHTEPDAARRRALEEAARKYLSLASAFLRPAPARLIAIGGFSGSGKSTLARGLAPAVGVAPGALILRSDVVRKTLLGVSPTTHLSAEGYSPAITQRVYRTIAERAVAALRAGYSVVVDAVFARREDRDAIAAATRDVGVPFTGLWLEGAPDVMARRIADRTLDASDADASVLDQQLHSGSVADEWTRLDASGSADVVLLMARSILEVSSGLMARP
jgi:aminoglycoside phosphotransferase family enzyme/predicted kinase